jgi:hypothetical protein
VSCNYKCATVDTVTLSGKYSPSYQRISMVPISVPGLLVAVLVLLVLRVLLASKKRYPPGPTGLPVVGNIRDFVAGRWYETFTKWQKLYGAHYFNHMQYGSMVLTLYTGGIVFAPSLGQPAYIINSYPLAEEVLGKGQSTSGRPYSRMFHEL